jgi:hypothetical protein
LKDLHRWIVPAGVPGVMWDGNPGPLLSHPAQKAKAGNTSKLLPSRICDYGKPPSEGQQYGSELAWQTGGGRSLYTS